MRGFSESAILLQSISHSWAARIVAAANRLAKLKRGGPKMEAPNHRFLCGSRLVQKRDEGNCTLFWISLVLTLDAGLNITKAQKEISLLVGRVSVSACR